MTTPNPHITTLLDGRPQPITATRLRDELDALIEAGHGDAVITTTNNEATLIFPPFENDRHPTIRIR